MIVFEVSQKFNYLKLCSFLLKISRKRCSTYMQSGAWVSLNNTIIEFKFENHPFNIRWSVSINLFKLVLPFPFD